MHFLERYHLLKYRVHFRKSTCLYKEPITIFDKIFKLSSQNRIQAKRGGAVHI